jgi:D-glycero-D-manno-heptose 1,7-bisphosphate phosphatase
VEHQQPFFYDLRPCQRNGYRAAVFLDRDGVLIEEKHYLKDPQKVEFLPGSIEALRILNSLDVFVGIVSNQAGVAKGILTLDDVNRVNERLFLLLEQHGVYITALMYCPYHPQGVIPEYTRDEELRKPKTGMFQFMKRRYNLDDLKLFMVGDKYNDVLFGQTIGAVTYLVETGYGADEAPRVRSEFSNVGVGRTLLEVVGWISGLVTAFRPRRRL